MKTYLFDFDGTIVDSMPYFVSSMLRILDENGISYGDDIIKVITPLGIEGTASHFVKMGVNRTKEEIIEKIVEYLQESYRLYVPAKPHVVQVLRQLRESGAGLNILTANTHVIMDACISRLGIQELFDNIWSSDDFGITKTNPEIYKMAAQRIGAPVQQILFLDDNLNANKAAKLSGMQVCGVYDPSSAEYVDEMKQLTDYYIYDFTELLAL